MAKKVIKPRVPKKYIYHILITSYGKQLKDLFWTDTYEKVMKKANSMLKENEKILFPVRYLKLGKLCEANYELVIIKYKDENESSETLVRGNSGKFEKYVTSNKNWIVCERFPYDFEETFFVYGYHPRFQRKTCQWIFDEFIEKDSKDKYKFKEVVLLNNKLIVEEAGNMNMVLCKNISDGIRLYNKLEEMAHKKKCKYIMFGGKIERGKRHSEMTKKIMEWTGWNYNKVRRTNLRP